MEKINFKTLGTVALVIGGIGFVWFLASFVVPRALVTMTKAAPALAVDVGKSFVLGSKILAKADGVDKIVVNVFLVDKDGKGVPGKSVTVSGLDSLNAINPVTDNDGKVTFEGTSSIALQYKLEASYSGVSLPRGITVTFR